MRKAVKPLVLFTSFFISYSCFSQLRINPTDGFTSDLRKIIAAFPGHFIDYRGEILVENPQSTDYSCTMKVKGTEEERITTYSGKKEIWSWEGLLMTTENFEKAKQKFHSLYNQLNNLSISGDVRLKGKYEAPIMEKKFSSVVFTPNSEKSVWEKLRVELLMEFVSPMEWKIKLMVYDREREDEEEGKRKE